MFIRSKRFIDDDGIEYLIPLRGKTLYLAKEEPTISVEDDLPEEETQEAEEEIIRIYVDEVLELYENELDDYTTDHFKVFSLFANASVTSRNKKAFSTFFNGLYEDDDTVALFDMDDILFFFSFYNYEYTLDNLWIFLNGYDKNTLKRYVLADKLFNLELIDNGNIYNFINTKLAEEEDDSVSSEDVRLFYTRKDYIEFVEKYEKKDLILTPKIAYHQPNTYKTIMNAEADYWSTLDSIADYASTIKIQSIHELERNLKVDKKIPYLIQKPTQKNGFSNINTTDNLIHSILKKDFLNLSITEVFYHIDILIEDLIYWLDNVDVSSFNYYDDESFPDFSEFGTYMNDTGIKSLSTKNADNRYEIDLEINKKLKFYIYIVFPFCGITSIDAAITTLNTDINTEFEEYRLYLENIKTELKTKYFE